MKITKKIAAIMLCALTAFSLFACGGVAGEDTTDSVTTEIVPETISVTVKVKTADSVLLDKVAITLRDRTIWPTVLDALMQACSAYEIPCEITADGLSVSSINKLGQTDDGMYWSWTLNGKAPSDEGGRAGSNKVKEGDAIEFSYISINK